MSDNDRWEFLLSKAAEICKLLGLNSNLAEDLLVEDSDWAFVLKVDALLEMSCRTLISNTLRIVISEKSYAGPVMDKFVSKLPATGRSSLRDLLEVAGCPPDRIGFLDAVRQIRNAYAHDIKCCDETLLAMIMKEKNASRLLQTISAVQANGYDYNEHLILAMKDHFLLRFSIMHETLQFLSLSYRQWADGELPG